MDVVREFAALLAAEENPAARASLLKRASMLAMKEAPASAFEPPVMTLGEYLDTPIEVPPSLVWPTICVRGEITATLGRAGKGKTTMNLNRICKWACGRPMFEGFTDTDGRAYLAPEEPLRVLIIENEGAAGMFHLKMGTLLNNCGDVLTDDDRAQIRENVYVWGDGGYSGLKLDDPASLATVRAGVEKCKPDIVFIEPMRSLWRGEENSSTEMAVVVDNLVGLGTDYGCGVILSHHMKKNTGEDGEPMGDSRGSTVLEGVVAVMENFTSVKAGDYREMTWSKARYLQPPIPMRLEYDRETGWYQYVPLDMLETAIIQALEENSEEPMNVSDLADSLEEKSHKIRPLLDKLVTAGRIKKMPSVPAHGGGTTGNRYRLPSGDNDTGGLPI